MTDPRAIEALLAHDAWLRRLAARLVAGRATADDAVQQTWLNALRKPPRHDGNLRASLADVLRSSLRNQRRYAP